MFHLILTLLLLTNFGRNVSLSNVNKSLLNQNSNESISRKDINVKNAKKWFDFYYSDGREDFENAFKRGMSYKKTISLILSKYSIPTDFYYLAMTESYFNNHAQSNKKAVGIWQFIPSTAKAYDLIINPLIDERRHPVKASIAAAKYLKDLHNIFQDWALAAAAYNCGEYRLLNAIRKGKTRSFSELSAKKLLPSETINYVNKFWVTREIDHKLRSKKLVSEDVYLNTVPIKLNSRVEMDTLSQLSEIPLKEILLINPDLSPEIKALPGKFTFYLPRKNAVLFQNFIKNNGVMSKLKNPSSLKRWGLTDLQKGDQIKIMFISKNTVKVRNIRTKEEAVVKASDLTKI